MEKSDPYSERIEAVSTSTPAMSDAEKQQHDDAVGANLELDESSLPPGYFTSKFFIGSMAGIGLGLMAGVAAFGYAAPILGLINADIGPVGVPCLIPTPISGPFVSEIRLLTCNRTRTSFGLPSATLLLPLSHSLSLDVYQTSLAVAGSSLVAQDLACSVRSSAPSPRT
jgi:hypothetical protein